LLFAILLHVPIAAFGDASDFIPTIVAPQGRLEVNVANNNDEVSSGDRVSRSSNSYAAERLRLSTNGFVYHPRFIQFYFQGAGGLSQENSSSTFVGNYSYAGHALEWEFRMKFLPEHPYNLELYTLSRTPLIQGRSSIVTRTTTYDKGAIFNYKLRPLSLNLSYEEIRLESMAASDETRIAQASAGYFISHFTANVGHSRSESSSSLGIGTSNDNSYFTNTISWFKTSLLSSVRRVKQEQNVLSGYNLDTGQLTWTEQFNSELPWNLSTSIYYNFQKDDRKIFESSAEPANESITETTNSFFNLNHRLYDSVRTHYGLQETRIRTDTGNTTSLTNALDGMYTKRIPDGLLTIGALGSHMTMEQENSLRIVGEIYLAPLFGAFTLSRNSITPESITIEVVSESGALIPLTLNTNYILEPFGSSFRVTIVSLPAFITVGHPVDYSYTFSVSYATIAGTGTLERNTIGFNVNLSLFDSLFNPFFSNLHTRQYVLTGYIPGGAQDTKTNTVGVFIQKAPVKLTSQYQVMESYSYPSRSLKNTVEYTARMTKNSSIYTTAERTKTVYGAGYRGTTGLTEYITAINANINRNVPSQNLVESLIVTYIQRIMVIRSDTYVLTGNLSWSLGTLSINTGLSLSRQDLSGSIGSQTRLAEAFYLMVTRRLF
jgi:hypothetical protein